MKYRYWRFDPRPDITAFELAQILQMNYGHLAGIINSPVGCDPLPARHFRLASPKELKDWGVVPE